MYRILVPCSHQFALLVHANPDLQRTSLHGMPTEPPMPELAIPNIPWNPGTIAFIFDQWVPYCPRESQFERDIDRMIKKIGKGAHQWRKGSRDGKCLWKQSNIGKGLGGSVK
jgi:hypothetical protein